MHYATSQSSLIWQYVAHLLKTSAAMGTVELTGLEMMATQACGQYLATAAHKSRTMPAACNLGILVLLGSPCMRCHTDGSITRSEQDAKPIWVL